MFKYHSINPDFYWIVIFMYIFQCASTRKSLLIVVHTSASHRDFRNTIRKTWGHPGVLEELQASVLFFVGRTHDLRVEHSLQAESKQYGDIVQSGKIIFENVCLLV